jgi:putative SOS response-associated peptidase YedK
LLREQEARPYPCADLKTICNNLGMCGRYRLSRRKQLIEEYFETASSDVEWPPRYNIAPTQTVPIVRQHATQSVRQLSMVRWGLIPSWSDDAFSAAKMINARSESAATLPAFRDAMKSRRCVIPADGFYEWKRNGKIKQPFCFEIDDGKLFAFAGIWERWQDPTGQWIKSCSILTTAANAVMAPVHDRMPVILDPDDYDLWLDPGMKDATVVSELLKPYGGKMRAYPVSSRVNHVANDDAECSAPVEAHVQEGLFS